MTIRKKKKDFVCSINFFNIKKAVSSEKLISTLKKDLYDPILKLVDDPSDDVLTTGIVGNRLDFELNYMLLRDKYDQLVVCSSSIYKSFYNTKFGKSLKKFGIAKQTNKLAKERGDIRDEACQLLNVMNKYDLLA
tara:strand:- start:140 stop:544 length:405 start_codon:yes stop_codon:yes gene_type:complete